MAAPALSIVPPATSGIGGPDERRGEMLALVSDILRCTEQLRRGGTHAFEIIDRQREEIDVARRQAEATCVAVQRIASEVARLSEAIARIRDQSALAHGAAEEMGRSTASAVDANTRLGAEVAGIAATTRDIDALSRKSRILAINAAIEAAHAGREGAAFSVVAKEVQQLARQTTEHTVDIQGCVERVDAAARFTADLTRTVRAEVDHVGAAIGGTIAAADAQQDSARGILDTSHELSAAADTARGSIAQIAGAFQAMVAAATMTHQVGATIDDRANAITALLRT